ncbi:MAG TPA: Ig-like domain-containing protein, partial [Conexibacter sp.]|nr:Ig-like domain-containing protein [Conexibacter sp.]
MRQAPHRSTVHRRAIVAAVLALGFVLAIAALAWAAPSLSIDSGPSGPTNDNTPVFGFTVDASATTVECSIDQGTPAYGPCSGAATDTPAAPLPDGDYTFRVRATDAQSQQTEVTQSFTVDTVPPSLSIDSGPSGPTNDATPSFGFTAEAGATVECSVDQGTAAYGPCTSATTHVVGAPLVDGSYVFRVQATDAAGNQTVMTQSFTVDTVPPSLSIDSGPSGPTNDATPSFGFTAEAGATVEC